MIPYVHFSLQKSYLMFSGVFLNFVILSDSAFSFYRICVRRPFLHAWFRLPSRRRFPLLRIYFQISIHTFAFVLTASRKQRSFSIFSFLRHTASGAFFLFGIVTAFPVGRCHHKDDAVYHLRDVDPVIERRLSVADEARGFINRPVSLSWQDLFSFCDSIIAIFPQEIYQSLFQLSCCSHEQSSFLSRFANSS